MPGYEGAVINVISASNSLASTSIFEVNMNNTTSVTYDSSPSNSSNIYTVITPSYESTTSVISSSTSEEQEREVEQVERGEEEEEGEETITDLNICSGCLFKQTRLEEEEEEDEGYASGDESNDLIDRESEKINVDLIEEEFKDTGLLFSSEEDFITMDELNGSYLNKSYEEFSINDNNTRDDNETYIEGLYPSGYSLVQIIFASIAATILMIIVVVGNMLVIIAIATEKALKNIQNWFIASLAVADFFLGLIIMPFSLANEIMGYWIFGYWWCDIYSAMDVLLCTASIMNLCLISLDRYWSITQAVKYLKKRTPARAFFMITLVWILSALICIPPLLGWKRPSPEEEFPKCKVILFYQ